LSSGWKEVKEALKKDRVFNSKCITYSVTVHMKAPVFVHQCYRSKILNFLLLQFTFTYITTGTRIYKNKLFVQKSVLDPDPRESPLICSPGSGSALAIQIRIQTP
jgi:hypothetical protein